MRSMARDGGNLDFSSFARSLTALPVLMRELSGGYQRVEVNLSIPVLDKYGASQPINGGTLIWPAAELRKVKSEALPDTVLRLANEVRLRGPGRTLAAAYCKESSLKDPRYCK